MTRRTVRVLEILGLSKQYSGFVRCASVELTIAAGERVSIGGIDAGAESCSSIWSPVPRCRMRETCACSASAPPTSRTAMPGWICSSGSASSRRAACCSRARRCCRTWRCPLRSRSIPCRRRRRARVQALAKICGIDADRWLPRRGGRSAGRYAGARASGARAGAGSRLRRDRASRRRRSSRGCAPGARRRPSRARVTRAASRPCPDERRGVRESRGAAKPGCDGATGQLKPLEKGWFPGERASSAARLLHGDGDFLRHDRLLVRNMQVIAQHELQRVFSRRQLQLRLGLSGAEMLDVVRDRQRRVEVGQRRACRPAGDDGRCSACSRRPARRPSP